MDQVRLTFEKIREIPHLKHEAGLTNREIVGGCSISISPVGDIYIER